MPTPEKPGNDTQAPGDALAQRWLDALLPRVPAQGWSPAALADAARVAGLSPDQQALAAPDGANSLIEAFLMRGDHAMLAALASRQDEPMRTRDRVALAVMAWMEPLRPHKAALKRAVGRGALPGQMPRAFARTWRLADTIWTGVGDTATDHNRYTKRGLLALILPQVVLFWLQTDDDAAVRAFLDRRIGEVMQAGRTVGGAVSSLLSVLNLRRSA